MEEEKSFLPTLLFRAICSLRIVSTLIYDKIYDYVYMNSRKYELVHTLFVFSFCLKESEKRKKNCLANTALFFLVAKLSDLVKRNVRMAKNRFLRKFN
jgi:hypothetical protein